MANNKENHKDGTNNSGSIKGVVKVAIIENFTSYIFYSDGRVYNRVTDTWLNANTRSSNYLNVTLRDDNNNRVTRPLHRLMYEVFIGDIPDGMQINHKDENKTNNVTLFNSDGTIAYTNLEIVTPKENCNHGSRNERIRKTETGKKRIKQTFEVVVIDPKTNEKITE